MTHEAYDLGRLAQMLRKRKDFKPLVQAIRDVTDMHSAHTDLLYARDASRQLQNLGEIFPAGPKSCEALCQSLLMYMVILYARATKTTQTSRKTFDLRSRFNDAQKRAHKEICDLRDDAFAHFGTGGTYSGVAPVRETAYMKPVPGDMKFGVLSRRLTYDPELAQLLDDQIGVALPVMETQLDKKQESVVDLLTRFSTNQEVVDALQKCPLDANAFLGSSTAGDEFYRAPIVALQRSSIEIDSSSDTTWPQPRD